jgi:SAM-dependent methyltransferase
MDATLYDELHHVEQTHWWFRARRHIVWSLVQRYIGRPVNQRLRVCELGCGTGGNLAAIADKHDVVGIECSPQALSYARQSLGSRVLYGRLPYDIDLPLQSFDVLLMTDVLEHIEGDRTSAITALRLLRPGGIIIATVPAYQWLYSPRDRHHHHVRRYSKRRFAGLWKQRSAQIALLSHYNSFLFAPAAVMRLASKLLTRENPAGDLFIPTRSFNELLSQIMRSEANLLGRLPLPFGMSLIAVVRKCAADATNARSAAA